MLSNRRSCYQTLLENLRNLKHVPLDAKDAQGTPVAHPQVWESLSDEASFGSAREV